MQAIQQISYFHLLHCTYARIGAVLQMLLQGSGDGYVVDNSITVLNAFCREQQSVYAFLLLCRQLQFI
jgi:hypothetical protein